MKQLIIKKDGTKLYESPGLYVHNVNTYLFQFLENEGYEVDYKDYEPVEKVSKWSTDYMWNTRRTLTLWLCSQKNLIWSTISWTD